MLIKLARACAASWPVGRDISHLFVVSSVLARTFAISNRRLDHWIIRR